LRPAEKTISFVLSRLSWRFRRRPCVQVLNLCLARVRANARYHQYQICVVGEFEDSIARVYRARYYTWKLYLSASFVVIAITAINVRFSCCSSSNNHRNFTTDLTIVKSICQPAYTPRSFFLPIPLSLLCRRG